MKDHRIRAKHPEMLSGRALLERWILRGRMTQAEAAAQIGISRVKLNQYLNEEARPSLETAIRIEDSTGIGVRLWLLDDVTNGIMACAETPRNTRGNTAPNDSEVNHNLTYRTPTGVSK